MPKVTKRILEVVEMLKGGQPLNFETYVTQLGCKAITAMVYISELRVAYGAEIETIRDGRKVTSYRLLNQDHLDKFIAKLLTFQSVRQPKAVPAPKVPKVKVNKLEAARAKVVAVRATAVTKKVIKDSDFDVPVLDADMDISEISDREFADLRDQLGL
jgi:hypothetical protein